MIVGIGLICFLLLLIHSQQQYLQEEVPLRPTCRPTVLDPLECRASCLLPHKYIDIKYRNASLKKKPKELPPQLLKPDYIPSEEEVDMLYLGCDADRTRPNKPMAIVRPFVYKNNEELLKNLGYWEMNDLLPCTSKDETRIDLIFYFHRAIECNPSIKEAIQAMLLAIPR